MPKKLIDELKEAGINAGEFLNVYHVVRAVQEVNLPYLSIPRLGAYQLGRVFNYMDKKGVVRKKDGDIYEVIKDGIDVMEAKIRADELEEKVEVPKRIHGE